MRVFYFCKRGVLEYNQAYFVPFMSFSFDALNTPNVTPYLAGVAILIFIVFLFFLIYLNSRINKLLGGSSAKSIEQSLAAMKEEIDSLIQFKEESVQYLRSMEERVKRSAQSIETIRFNPFKGTGDGGNQSFSTTILNENGDGVIISSLYSRERVSIFSKPIKDFNPEYELSEEEKESLSKAKENLSLKKSL